MSICFNKIQIKKINNERRGYKNEYESNDANAVTAAFR